MKIKGEKTTLDKGIKRLSNYENYEVLTKYNVRGGIHHGCKRR